MWKETSVVAPTLLQIVARLKVLDREMTIYAVEPWSAGSPAIVARGPEDGGLPSEAAAIGAEYFIEVFIAADFVEDWLGLEGPRSDVEICARLIEYAIADA